MFRKLFPLIQYSRYINTNVKMISIPRPNIINHDFPINSKSEIISICDNYHNDTPRRKILLGTLDYKTEFYVRNISKILNFDIDKITDITGLRCVKNINDKNEYIGVSSQSDLDTIIHEYNIIGQANTIIKWEQYFAFILSRNDLSEKSIPINIINIATKHKIILMFL